jgi:hypothetical protein
VVDRLAFVETIRSFEGTPYSHQGRLPGVAMDCPAPLIVACWIHGLKPRSFDVTGYGQAPDGSLKRYCDEHMAPIPYSEAREADVILAGWERDQSKPRHLGVIVERGERTYWVQAEGHRHKKVIRTRLVFGVDKMVLIQAYRIPGVV